MTHERPSKGRSESAGRRHFERTESVGRPASWTRVDQVIEVRSRLVFIAEALEDGDVRLAEMCVYQLVSDLDAAESILGCAA